MAALSVLIVAYFQDYFSSFFTPLDWQLALLAIILRFYFALIWVLSEEFD